ncbi:serine carboxypeptidase-like 2 isoform X2 [Cornus florida]|uniref:serine carboxypeptidase-like 2 isoform X2 n=1 Tax=Cornus florida TaxID=4283 RepID=UPI00289B242E|nr:serine carboxypeptidase-like 2 isoform X2 [Cornus florida]
MPSTSLHQNNKNHLNNQKMAISNSITKLYFLLLLHFGSQIALSYSSMVKFLPGFEGPLPFHLETGYVGVDESEDVQLFYYFVKSESNPEDDPLVLWLTGGPGCTSFTALIYEIGPLNFEAVQYNGSLPTLVLNPNSWTKAASIIFLDLPVGTGFSYARTSRASHSVDIQSCDQAVQFLRKWLIDHPEFISNPVYVGGDSYSGLTVPVIVQMMSNGNEAGIEPSINLKGYLLGNPITLPASESNYQIPFAHGMALISDELYESLKRSCRGEYQYPNIDPTNSLCLKDLQAFDQSISGIQNAHVLEKLCGFASPKPHELFGKRLLNEKSRELSVPEPSSLSAFSCRIDGYLLSYYWISDDRVQEALHIRKGSIGNWIRCDHGLSYTPTIKDSFHYHVNLSTKGYRSLIYSGDHDMIVPFLSTQAWIRSLNYSIVDDWHSWIVEGQVAGYTRTYSNGMTFVTVKGGGHTAPEYRPKECSVMFKRWIVQEPL